MEINFDLKITREKKSRFDWIDFEKICSKLIISLFHDAKRNIFENCLGNNAYKISMQTNNRAITTSSIASSNIQMQRFSMKRFSEIKLSSVRLFRGHFLAPTQFLNTLEKHFSIEYRGTRFVLFFPSIVFEHSDTFGFFNEIN